MPKRESRICATRTASQRRWLLTLLLLPVAGCSASWNARNLVALKPSLPWSSDSSHRQTEVIAAATDKPLFQSAAYRTAHPVSPDEIDGEPDAIEGTLEQLPEPVERPLPAETIAGEEIAGEQIDGTIQVIDLGSALGMAGGNAWTIQLARQRTVEAHADVRQARALWLPSLQFGVGWNKHDGRIQATPGQVIETSRSSLFVGGGATLGAPVAGGSGGPLRLQADLALADAYFEPKIAGRTLSAQKAGVSVATNQALRDAGIAYVELVDAAGQVADAQAAIAAASELLELTRTFEQAGAGAQADVDRAATEQARLTGRLHNANRLFRVRSAALSRRLRLDPRFVLQPADQVVVPIELAADAVDLDSQIATALSRRPEIIEQSHRIAGLCLAVKKADIEPWLPSVTMATSGGNFGGGRGSNLDNQASRSDVDLQAVWELESLGVGVSARRSRAGSRLAQQRIELADLRDEITSQVVQAFENVMNYRAQIDAAEAGLVLAEASYQRNLQRVRADEGLPIELLQAISARAVGLRDRTAAVTNYNRAQLELLYATGQLKP